MKAFVVGFLSLAFSFTASAKQAIPECANFRNTIDPQAIVAEFTQKLKQQMIWTLTSAFEESGIRVAPNMFEWSIQPEFQFFVNGEQSHQMWSLFQKNGADKIIVHAPNKDYVFPVWPVATTGGGNRTAKCFESTWGNWKNDCISVEFEYIEGYNKFNALGEPIQAICKARLVALHTMNQNLIYQIRNDGKASPRYWEVAPPPVVRQVEVPITGHL